jgi:hypothetical protein
MGNLEVFFGVAAAILAILVMVISAKEKEEVRQQAYKEGRQYGASETSLEAFTRGVDIGIWEGRKIGVEHLSPEQILNGIRRYIYICGKDTQGREAFRSGWIIKVSKLNVDREEEIRSDWIKAVRELNVEQPGRFSWIERVEGENISQI